MISKRITARKDGKSSSLDALRYGAGINPHLDTGVYQEKSHRIRFGGFGLIENGVYFDQDIQVMADMVDLAALEMQTNCDLNTKVADKNKLAHFVFSYDQDRPTETELRDTEDSMLVALKLDKNHFATFLQNDNGHWHLHVFASRIENYGGHRGNSLWQDKTIRDRVCREIEIRHLLKRDRGLHEIDSSGNILKIPIEERRARREKEKSGLSVSDGARKFETHTGERSFQGWCNEIRIGDRLKHSKGWQELHDTAAAYSCEIKQKGAGYIICPRGEKGGMQLSKAGLKNLVEKFGIFEPANPVSSQQQGKRGHEYKSEPTKHAGTLFEKWKEAKSGHKSMKLDELSEFRETASIKRFEIRARQRAELANIRSSNTGTARVTAISIAKMQHASALAELADATRIERSTLYKRLANVSPGATFRDYLLQQAQAGNDTALVLVKQYGKDESTNVAREAEELRLRIVAAFSGRHDEAVPRLPIKHQVDRNGTVTFYLGEGRTITDSSISNQIQLNATAANDPDAIEISLRFAVARFGNPLRLTGTAEFQRLAVQTAVRKNLLVKYEDPALEKYRKEFSANTFNLPTLKEKQHVERNQEFKDQRKPSPSSRDHRLYRVPALKLDSKSARHQMLLQNNVPVRMEQQGWTKLQGRRLGVRQPAAAGRSTGNGSKPHSYHIATPVFETEQECRAEVQQEIVHSASTHAQHVTFTTKEVLNPSLPNVQSRLVAAQKIKKVER